MSAHLVATDDAVRFPANRIGATAWVCDADVAHRPAAERRARGEASQPGLLGVE